jgi:hypothetical protein
MTTLLSDLTSGKPHSAMGERDLGGARAPARRCRPRAAPNPLLNVLALAGGAYRADRGAKGFCPIKATLVDHGADARSPVLERAGDRERLA